MHTRDICLATTVTDSYVPGAVAMLGSFRAHHPGFDGDVVILHDGLSEARRRESRAGRSKESSLPAGDLAGAGLRSPPPTDDG